MLVATGPLPFSFGSVIITSRSAMTSPGSAVTTCQSVKEAVAGTPGGDGGVVTSALNDWSLVVPSGA